MKLFSPNAFFVLLTVVRLNWRFDRQIGGFHALPCIQAGGGR